jgi:hypothetical protein
MDELAWCTFRNLAQAVYREARHIGPSGDPNARLILANDHYAAQAANCRKWRSKLQSLDLYETIADKKTTTSILRPYREATGLAPADLVALFRSNGWQGGYGGERWAVITDALVRLADALDNEEPHVALAICDQVETMWHNSASLVPSRDDWEASQWTRQKWPCLCR